jgi:hypothetical protein
MSKNPQSISFQNTPDLEEFPCFDVDIVSPELPCGVAWLANCFLELNIPIWKPWGLDIQHYWQRLSPYQYRYNKQQTSFSHILPALKTGRAFSFIRRPTPRFSHRWPLTLPDNNKTILFVRDPRDALYSGWQRQIRNQQIETRTPFEVFMSAPYHHYPFANRDYLLLFLRMWKLVLSEQEHLIIRFEDYKGSPRKTLQRVLDFIDINVTEEAINNALLSSDFKNVKTLQDNFSDSADNPKYYSSRAGLALEYRHSYNLAMHESVGERFNQLYQWLGYESYTEGKDYSSLLKESPEQLNKIMQALDIDLLNETFQYQIRSLVERCFSDISEYK